MHGRFFLLIASTWIAPGCFFFKQKDVEDTDPVSPPLTDTAPVTTPLDACSDEAVELVELINTWRREQGETKISLSPSMCATADAHVTDLVENAPNQGNCSQFSWSDAGDWTPCCYDLAAPDGTCIWNKPMEITGYPGNGYEAISIDGDEENTPSEAFGALTANEGIADQMLEEGDWSRRSWKAIGAAIRGPYASVWFGEERDPAR